VLSRLVLGLWVFFFSEGCTVFLWVLEGLLGWVAFGASLGVYWGPLLYLGFGFHVGFGCLGPCGFY
jgi:hypothetical protein